VFSRQENLARNGGRILLSVVELNHAIRNIESAIETIRQGKMIILVDSHDRENEGDLVIAAEDCDATAINFMARYARGLICVPLEGQILERLELVQMVSQNTEQMRTAFTVSVDASAGVSTGISAPDRARTVQVLADPSSGPDDLVRPGHIFPLRAVPGGVLRRAGHTEASVDLCRLAGKRAAAVICEIMNEDGSMARLPDLEEFSRKHEIPLFTIQDLIYFRRQRDSLIRREATSLLPTEFGDFTIHVYSTTIDDKIHVALVMGDVAGKEDVLVRVHSECLTGDIFHSGRCDCGEQLHKALSMIAEAGQGVLLYIRQEGRGIGLINKIKAYALQDTGLDTVEANQRLGFEADLRDYGIGAQILADLKLSTMRLITNNPRKIVGLEGYGLKISGRMGLHVPPGANNMKYLQTKKTRLGHMLDMV